jgi:CDP-diacylglycerol--glycerol-3-phosphate 3-phosphatidyltransferase
MLDQKIRDGWDRLMRPVGRAFSRAGLSANVVTVASVVVMTVSGALIIQGRVLAAGLVAIVAAVGDGIDGAIAKVRGTTDRFGALLDSTSDRLSDALLMVPIAWLYGVAPDIAERDAPWVAGLAIGTLVVSFLVSYVRARAEGLGLECKVGIAERAERMILLIAGLILNLVPYALAILCFLSVVTLIQRIAHVRAQVRTGPA